MASRASRRVRIGSRPPDDRTPCHCLTRRDADGRAQGLGDTTLTLKRAWVVDEVSAFGMELAAKLPTANDAIGGGKADASINATYSRDLGPVLLTFAIDIGVARATRPTPATTLLLAGVVFPLAKPW